MDSPIKSITPNTFIPLSLAGLLVMTLIGGAVYIISLNSDVAYIKQEMAKHEVMDDARVQALDVRVQVNEQKSAVTAEKLDTIMNKIDAISKKLNVL